MTLQTQTLRAQRFQSVPQERQGGTTKDTRRWCKGVYRREHRDQWQYWFQVSGSKPRDWFVKRCLECGRQLGLTTLDSRKPPTPQLREQGKL